MIKTKMCMKCKDEKINKQINNAMLIDDDVFGWRR